MIVYRKVYCECGIVFETQLVETFSIDECPHCKAVWFFDRDIRGHKVKYPEYHDEKIPMLVGEGITPDD